MAKKTVVIVQFTAKDGAYSAGTLAGFEPEMAQHLVERVKKAKYHTEQPTDEAKAFVAGRAAPVKEEPAAAPVAPVSTVTLPEDVDLTIEIPGDWKDVHHKTRMGLASKIMKNPVDADETARAVIEVFIAAKGETR